MGNHQGWSSTLEQAVGIVATPRPVESGEGVVTGSRRNESHGSETVLRGPVTFGAWMQPVLGNLTGREPGEKNTLNSLLFSESGDLLPGFLLGRGPAGSQRLRNPSL